MTGATLTGATLTGVDLAGAHLMGAHLAGTNLSGTHIDKSTQINSKWRLVWEILNEPKQGRNLTGADLTNAALKGTNLIGADLTGANLIGADLTNADLTNAALRGTHIDKTTQIDGKWRLVWEILNEPKQERNLSGANLSDANLSGANLSGANLSGANLTGAILIKTNFTETNITGVYFYGTARDDWVIDGIKCDFVYWNEKPDFVSIEQKQQWEQEHRVPRDRDFRFGEFEELYKQLPTFKYYFEQGFTPVDAVIMSQTVQTIGTQHPEMELRLDSFHSRGRPHAVFTVLQKEYTAKALKQITIFYEKKLAALEGKREQLLELFTTLTDKPQYAITGGKIVMGDEVTTKARRDYFENVTNSHVTTGDSFHDNAQKLMQAMPQAPQQDILRVLSFIQEQLPQLPLPEDVKEEMEHEIKGAEIQAKKPEPDKKKLTDRLKNAVAALKGAGELGQEAVLLGQLIGKAIQWCGENWIG